MQEQCYVFVHDKEKLSKFFEEDSDLVQRRTEATNKRDRLAKANSAMANIQVTSTNKNHFQCAPAHPRCFPSSSPPPRRRRC